MLKLREDELRSEVLADPDDLAGDDNEAMLCQSTRTSVDLELMKRELGMLFLRPFLREQAITSIRVKPIKRRRKPIRMLSIVRT